MISAILLHTILAGCAISLLTGPVGCLMVWNRMSYFGEVLAHSSLLGICIASFIHVPDIVGMMITGFLLSILFVYIQNKKYCSGTIMVMFAQVVLAMGVLLMIYFKRTNSFINILIGGDLLTTNYTDIIHICILDFICLIWLYCNRKKLLMLSMSEEISAISGINVQFIKIQFLFILSIFIAASIHLVGSLLIVSLLIIPVFTGCKLSSTPYKTIMISSCCSIISVILGIILAFMIDIPCGPAVVLITSIIFASVHLTCKS